MSGRRKCVRKRAAALCAKSMESAGNGPGTLLNPNMLTKGRVESDGQEAPVRPHIRDLTLDVHPSGVRVLFTIIKKAALPEIIAPLLLCLRYW